MGIPLLYPPPPLPSRSQDTPTPPQCHWPEVCESLRYSPLLWPYGALRGGGTCQGQDVPRAVRPGSRSWLWLKVGVWPPSPSDPQVALRALVHLTRAVLLGEQVLTLGPALPSSGTRPRGRQIPGLGLEENPGWGKPSRPVPDFLGSVLSC